MVLGPPAADVGRSDVPELGRRGYGQLLDPLLGESGGNPGLLPPQHHLLVMGVPIVNKKTYLPTVND